MNEGGCHCNVVRDETLGHLLRKDLGMALSAGPGLGSVGGVVLRDGIYEGSRLGLAECDGRSGGILLGADDVGGCTVGFQEGCVGVKGSRLS